MSYYCKSRVDRLKLVVLMYVCICMCMYVCMYVMYIGFAGKTPCHIIQATKAQPLPDDADAEAKVS